jgi:hypothetical protein
MKIFFNLLPAITSVLAFIALVVFIICDIKTLSKFTAIFICLIIMFLSVVWFYKRNFKPTNKIK